MCLLPLFSNCIVSLTCALVYARDTRQLREGHDDLDSKSLCSSKLTLSTFLFFFFFFFLILTLLELGTIISFISPVFFIIQRVPSPLAELCMYQFYSFLSRCIIILYINFLYFLSFGFISLPAYSFLSAMYHVLL